MGKSTINGPFSIAVIKCQMVFDVFNRSENVFSHPWKLRLGGSATGGGQAHRPTGAASCHPHLSRFGSDGVISSPQISMKIIYVYLYVYSTKPRDRNRHVETFSMSTTHSNPLDTIIPLLSIQQRWELNLNIVLSVIMCWICIFQGDRNDPYPSHHPVFIL